MIPIHSGIENQLFEFSNLTYILNRLGFTNDGTIDFDQGHLDYQLTHGAFLRIPFQPEIGNFDEPDAQVRIGRPYIERHFVDGGLLGQAAPDLNASSHQVEEANRLIIQVEQAILQ